MIRDLKVLSVGLAAMLAIAALSAPSASARGGQFHSSSSFSTTISGSQEGWGNTFSVNAGTIHCGTAVFSGKTLESTTNQVTIAPTYTGCVITTVTLETLEATVDINGCHYLLTSGGEVHLNCPTTNVPSPPPPHGIRITAPLCTITVKPQTLSGVDYINVGEGETRSLTVTSTVRNVVYSQSSFCPGGGGGTFANGTYSGSVATTCADSLISHAGCWWSTE